MAAKEENEELMKDNKKLRAAKSKRSNINDNTSRADLFNRAYEIIEYLSRKHRDFKHYKDPTRDTETLGPEFKFIHDFMRDDLEEMERLQNRKIGFGKRQQK